MSEGHPQRPATPTDRALSPSRERDACGIGLIADERGAPAHRVLRLALEALGSLEHRGALGADGDTSDGTGVLTQLPYPFLRRELRRLGIEAPEIEDGDLALVALFVPRRSTGAALRLVRHEVRAAGYRWLSWRPVPTMPAVLGAEAMRTRPDVIHGLFARRRGATDDTESFERRLYALRRRIEKRAVDAGLELAVVSLSHRTVVYKSMARPRDLATFYPDLRDPSFATAVALFHLRFSTNSRPAWRLAQPFRMLAHNGEINTLEGNVSWMRSRQATLASEKLGDLGGLLPILDVTASDSAMLDQMLELLVRAGRDPLHALLMLLPEASRERSEKDPDLRAFYEYHAGLLEPWDGPAAIVATDGRLAAAILDRNGLRPLRYWRTRGDLLVVASEAGVVSLPEADIVERGRLGPGQALAVDLVEGGFRRDADIKAELAARRPWRTWLAAERVEPPASAELEQDRPERDIAGIRRLQRAFGYTREAVERILDPMLDGQVPVGSMGNDAPPAVLSRQPQLLYGYFKQRFAQVTNPPIDPLRERLVFDLDARVGSWGNLLEERREAAHLIRFRSPILTAGHFRWLLRQGETDVAFRHLILDARWPVREGVDALRPALDALAGAAEEAVDGGVSLLVLTDRRVDREHAPIPMLLATAAVHHRLVRSQKRMSASLVCDTGEPREDHHVACLLAYGATLVHPWLAYETVADRASARAMSSSKAIAAYRKALEEGLLKVMARLGVCPLASYHGAQLLEALGLDADLVDRYFTGTPSRIGGIDLRTLADDVLALHRDGFPDEPGDGRLLDRGFFRYRRGGEHHDYSPRVFKRLHRAVRSRDPEAFRSYAEAVDRRAPSRLRDLLALRRAERPLPLAEVEPASRLVRRFATAAMSLGALSREAHEVLALGMNRLGARSNSGEGGEDDDRLRPGDRAASAVKQVASGRFGVTPYYLASAMELEIKMAQGSKPGEGGQIPGHKVTAGIARLRRAVPGMPLISPPPHHDIYSIEDLAQLIHDLKRVNPRARVGVKLVSVAGVGTIAVGVVKAGADYVQISGDDGGTGASPLSSIKHAGMPWELGLADAHRRLVENGLREQVTLRVDGGLKTGRDVALAAALGAEEFAFGTAPLLAIGCVMARRCHLDTCPVGIATQRQELRQRFAGTPDQVVAFMLFVAEHLRYLLAEVGARRLDEIVGRTDLLKACGDRAAKRGLSLAELLAPAAGRGRPRRGHGGRNPLPRGSEGLDERLLRQARRAVADRRPIRLSYEVTPRDRSLGAGLSGEIAVATSGRGLPPGSVRVDLRGAIGQSFGAFLAPGLDLRLSGEAQDGVGKGMAGGRLVLRLAGQSQVIAGNTLLYGATGGELFAAGRVGERFCVRNSGARAVVEGCGDHGCEYMTAGVAVVLGPIGRNFGAGMAGGVAYVSDPGGLASGRSHAESVQVAALTSEDREALHALLTDHAKLTGSLRARHLLARWPASAEAIVRIAPGAGAVLQPQPPPAEDTERPAVHGTGDAAVTRNAAIGC